MNELENFGDEVEVWHKPKDRVKAAIVCRLPFLESNAFSNFYVQAYQGSPLGWTPISKQYRYSTRQGARDKAHRLGYTVSAQDQ